MIKKPLTTYTKKGPYAWSKEDFKERLKTFILIVKNEVEKPDMDQQNPRYKNHAVIPHKCCFGARVCKAFWDQADNENLNIHDLYDQTGALPADFNEKRIRNKTGFYYEDGYYLTREFLSLSAMQLELVFWACGAGHERFAYYGGYEYEEEHSVFSSLQWSIEPAEFLVNLSQIETPPSEDFCDEIAALNEYVQYPTRDTVFPQLINQ